MKVGLSSFADLTPDPRTGERLSAAARLREVVDEAVRADEVGLDVYAVGEHHRPDFAASAPAVVLAAAAARTERIRLSSAVTVLSSADPVRVFQEFATLDGLSNGRAEIMAGRGSFVESFPLFGFDLDDYDELFSEKLDLLLALRESERVTWSGRHRPALHDAGIYPRPEQDPMPVWLAVGGTPQSVVRAGTLGLPLALAIIGGEPERFVPLAELYREAARRAGHDPATLPLAVHLHGFVADTTERAVETFYAPYAAAMSQIGRERGWPPMNPRQFEAMRAPSGSLAGGDVREVTDKLVSVSQRLGLDRMILHLSVGRMPHPTQTSCGRSSCWAPRSRRRCGRRWRRSAGERAVRAGRARGRRRYARLSRPCAMATPRRTTAAPTGWCQVSASPSRVIPKIVANSGTR